MKTYIQRWWIINKLASFSRLKGGIVWANKDEFLLHLEEMVVERSGYFETSGVLIKPWFKFLFEIENDVLVHTKLDNLIHECSSVEDGIGYFIVEQKKPNGFYLRLTSVGRERCGWGYVFFVVILGNAYIKAAIIGTFSIVVTFLMKGILTG